VYSNASVASMLRPVNSVTQSSSCYNYIIILTSYSSCKVCYTRMLYATLRVAPLRLCIHHTPHRITSLLSQSKRYGYYEYISSNKLDHGSSMHTYMHIPNRKGKSFFHIPKSDRGLGLFKVISVTASRFQNVYKARYL
jgi:hypothetical protein